ncbi:ArsR family transcriptional regulator [Puniceicoccaceae bacterium]|nr:ArsR family transcriptional regulator [Puniceicoccaceae bacterium]
MPTLEKDSATLSAWETSTIDVFIRAASLIGLPRSIGEIYGLLFCSSQSLTFDELVERLQISKGSVSQGLKVLRQLGAVKLHYVPGSRRDHYEPELSMKRLARGFIKDQFEPHMVSANQRLENIETLIAQEPNETLRQHAASRLNTLHSWRQRAQKLLPIIMAVLGGVNFLKKETAEETSVI